ncbi:uncharacterized protein Z518_03115 [Rhinocladiella mackenziei CBS 650.93]|uniref:ATP-dependent RNA helicase SUV3, mitochondrial n=1 Tax=Rhinocladiella mackenziei CBS 650.93 TaxID=1442369 RepID=A0A0D2IR70_9EURO|nr:uncharacterized protein Z518_03115 [Rhinocladiella mackenziei CBS 650.93]KIX08459.1 hypothetical protein Z518_03115 [Rhinocladiella mackenziei CBS 650.93]
MFSLWTRRGQCLLCSFRALVTAPSKQYPHGRNDYRTTQPSRRKISETSRRTKSAPNSRSTRANSRGASKSATLSSDIVLNRVRKALDELKIRLASIPASTDPTPNQLDALDPDQIYFKSFKESLEEILRFKDTSKSAWGRSIASEIGRSFVSPNWRQDLQKALHFGFIDHVLQKKTEESPGKTSPIADMRFPTEWYSGARQLQRDIHLHIGPTNSGKTYNALKRLEESGNGFYAGPLRLLAHEVFSRFKAKGVSCDLVTGDDVRLDDNPNVLMSASTVEMVDTSRSVEVGVIDEIQMITSRERGWAWTRAFLGANARELHLCGEPRVLPLIRELTASTGDTLHVHEYKRLNPLKVMTKSLKGDLKSLRKGDCIVTFSVMNIHAMKKQIEVDTGRRCAIVYGSLPPETRARQAALFNDPNNDYDFLVASDAIGMGLNLSVKRIIFHSVYRFNGSRMEQLTVSQIKQIGGRAGRYRSSHEAMNNSGKSDESSSASVGLVTTLNDEDLPTITNAMNAEDPPIKVAGLLPPGDYLEDISIRLPKGIPFEYLLKRLSKEAELHHRFKMCSIDDQSRVAEIIEPVRGLTTHQRILFTAVPMSSTSATAKRVVRALAECLENHRQVSIVDIPAIPLEILEQPVSGDRAYLESLEELHKSLIVFLWLSYRFVSTFKDRDMAMYAKELTEKRINTCLLEFSANPELRQRVLSYKYKMPLPRLPAHGNTPEATKTHNDFSQHPALPVDWTRGSSDLEFEEPQSSANAVTTHA